MKGKGKQKSKLSKEQIESVLIKKALGYDATEVVEEYAGDEQGEVRLLKKKVTIKNVPPDMTALKILLEGEQKNVSELSDAQLEEEKQRLLNLLKTMNKEGEKN